MSSRTVADTTSENAATIEEITVSSGHIADHAREADEAMLATREQSRRSAEAVNAMETQMRNIGTTIDTFTRIDSDGLGLLCGATSGNLEMLELEGRAVEEGYLDRLAQRRLA